MAKRIDVDHLNIYYREFLAVQDVSMTIEARSVTALIGPSGCGKSTFALCLASALRRDIYQLSLASDWLDDDGLRPFRATA